MRILSVLFFGRCGCSNYCSAANIVLRPGNIYIDRKLMKFRIDLHFDKTSCDDWFESSVGKSIVDDVLRAPLYLTVLKCGSSAPTKYFTGSVSRALGIRTGHYCTYAVTMTT